MSTVDPAPLNDHAATAEAIRSAGGTMRRSWETLSDSLDVALRELTDTIPGAAFTATGGYGRRELCLFSDVDLMVIVAGPVPDAVPGLFRAMWDAGLDLGHSVRSLDDLQVEGGARLDTFCSLLDIRLICGDEELFDAGARQLERLARRVGAKMRRGLADEEAARRTAEPYQLQAADLKRGRGGLRAFHGARWRDMLGRVVGEEAGREYTPNLIEPLLDTRQWLHATVGRRHDRLDPSLRHPVAAHAGLTIEELMARTLGAMRDVDRAAGHRLGELARGNTRGVGRSRRIGRRAGRHPRSSTRSDAGLWPDLVAAVEGSGWPIGGPTVAAEQLESPWTDAGRRAFLEIAAAGPAGRVAFDALADRGLLDDVLPEWSHVIAQPQLDPFHLHSVDDHMWRTARELVEIASPGSDEAWTYEMSQELTSIDDAILAALFHDIGKGLGGDHSVVGAELVGTFASRAGFSDRTAHTAATLVRHHLLLPSVATSQDLDDPQVIARVADMVGDLDTLRMMYLLSVADARATGPAVWSPWRASLLRRLFARCADALGDVSTLPSRRRVVDDVTRRLSPMFGEPAVRAHLEGMPDSYAVNTPAPIVARHLRAASPPPSGSEIRIAVDAKAAHDEVVVVTADRPGLLATVAGVLALHNVSVVEARLSTRADGVVFDRFQTVDSLAGGPAGDERWSAVRRDLSRVLSDDLDLPLQVARKAEDYRSRVDDAMVPQVRVIRGSVVGVRQIELRCADRVGLLHDVAAGCAVLGVDVFLAKIDTQGSRVVDTFHALVPDGLADADILDVIARAAVGGD